MLLIVGAMAAALLLLLFAAFSGDVAAPFPPEPRPAPQRASASGRSSRTRSTSRSITDGAGRITYESSAVERVLGYRAEDRIGLNALGGIHPDDRAWAQQMLHDVAKAPRRQVSAEVRVRHADGSWLVVEAVAKNLLHDPAVDGIVINYRDVTGRKSLEDELKHQAFHDSLTGLANRALFAGSPAARDLADRARHRPRSRCCSSTSTTSRRSTTAWATARATSC